MSPIRAVGIHLFALSLRPASTTASPVRIVYITWPVARFERNAADRNDDLQTMTMATAIGDETSHVPAGKLSTLMLGALGVVYGDIGTSPLYTSQDRACEWAGGATPDVAHRHAVADRLDAHRSPLRSNTLTVVMRADNDGEGGISRADVTCWASSMASAIVVIAHRRSGRGAALRRRRHHAGDLGVERARGARRCRRRRSRRTSSACRRWCWSACSRSNPRAATRIGKLFGPDYDDLVRHHRACSDSAASSVTRACWSALDPRYGFSYLFGHGFTGFLVLGAVFLCATGAEALYADMGHFGPRPIRFAWYGLVLPTLLLNYAGQTAMVVDGQVPARRQSVLHPVPAVTAACRSSRWQRSRPSSRANRSSAAHSQ